LRTHLLAKLLSVEPTRRTAPAGPWAQFV